MNQVEKDILKEIAGIEDFPDGAYNIRSDGKSIGRQSTSEIEINPKADGTGLDIVVAPGTKNQKVHIPVVVGQSGHSEVVYNDFIIGEDCDIEIVAGCGIHNCGSGKSQHDGIHSFRIGKGSRVLYIENHYGSGDGSGERVLNPVTKVYLEEDSYLEMDTVQIKGVDSTKRVTEGVVGDGATLIVKEKLMTHGDQYAETSFDVALNGIESKTNVISRSVATDRSKQLFLSKIDGNARCMGHSECDAIIMGGACVKAVPEITANHVDASLIHEAAIGKIAGEQIIKLMTLGLTEEEAEEQIVKGFLK